MRLIRYAILAAILAELWWAFQPRNLSSPKSEQMIAAIHTYQANPSAEAEAAMLEQAHRDSSRNARHGQIILGTMLLADVIVIYFFWNYGAKKVTA